MNSETFLCGVVEGFYGRPWTSDQRKELYARMHDMGMNAYVYAPKDDLKHRAEWRQLYTPEEADHLRNLIEKAEDENVTFVYALSPGIDMIYSSSKEQQCVKQKLQQVQSLGCKAFALLFDDIEPCMCDTDKKHFASFAYAQVAVTNATYEYLGNPPLFLFCPTEYCESRAVPTLEKSEYLHVLGKKLIKDIHILWTGPRVISRHLTEEHCKRVSKVICRKALIWDNLHANDYDSRRVFLGPYSGRCLSIRPVIAGVLTNPNCEFETNFVAMYTLAMWSIADSTTTKQGSDVLLEAGGEQNAAEQITRKAAPTRLYHPAQCLGEALSKWLPHLNGTKSRINHAGFGSAKSAGDSSLQGINTCGVITTTTQTSVSTAQFSNQIATDLSTQPIYTPASTVFSGTTDDGTTSSTNEDPLLTAAMQAVNSLSAGYCEPMQLAQTSDKEGDKSDFEVQMEGSSEDLSKEMQVDEGVDLRNETAEQVLGVTVEDLRDLADLFYLPFEHGTKGNWLISEFAWLTSNAPSVSEATRNGDKTATKEWTNRASEFVAFSTNLTDVYLKMFFCKNRQFIYDLYPYIWDARDTVALLAAYVLWLRVSNGVNHIQIGPDLAPIIQRSVTAIENGGAEDEEEAEQSAADKIRWPKDNESVGSSTGQETEPWVFRGGLVGELLRLFPLEGAELFPYRPAVPPAPKCFTFRPYCDEDKVQVYALSRCTFDDLGDASARFSFFPDLIGDRTIGPFLSYCSTDCFVVEETECEWTEADTDTTARHTRIVAFAAAAKDAHHFLQYCEKEYFPSIRDRYDNDGGKDDPNDAMDDKVSVSELISEVHGYRCTVPECVNCRHQSMLHMRCMQCVLDSAALHRLTALTLAAVKSKGSSGAYCQVRCSERGLMDMYNKVGMFDMAQSDMPPNCPLTVLARKI